MDLHPSNDRVRSGVTITWQWIGVCATALVVAVSPATAQQKPEGPCGNPFVNHFGPFDYRTAPEQTRGMVERPHFPPGVETLTKPSKTTFGQMAQDIAYTLHVFPNHPRALLTMARAAERFKADPAPGARYTVDCYFERGVQFRPDDTIVRALFAVYLAKTKRQDQAVRHLDIASDYAKDNPLSHFNIGLVYFDIGQYDRALKSAHTALALGNPRQELVDRLKRVNKWSEPSGS